MSSTRNTLVAPGNRLWPRWLAANVVAFALSHTLLGIIDLLVDVVGAHGETFAGIASHLGALGLGAAIVGLSQAVLIRAYVTNASQWGLASGIAYVIAFFTGEALGGLPLGLLISFTLFGAVSGALQSRILWQQGFPSVQWALGSCLGFAGGGIVATGLLLVTFVVAGKTIMEIAPVPIALATIGDVAGGVGAAITGPVLIWVVQHPSPKT